MRTVSDSDLWLSLREYASLKETAYLTASSANAHRLNDAIEELRTTRHPA